ncbi:MAG: PAS domain-containing sensor histidine kinase [Ignavibacteriota bacterium]
MSPKKSSTSTSNLFNLEFIFNNVTDLIFLVKIEGKDKYRFESVNESYLEVTKLKKEDIIGKTFEEVLSPNVFGNVKKVYDTIIKTGKSIVNEELWTDIPVSNLLVEVKLTPVSINSKKITHILGSARDITERKKREDMEVGYKALLDTVTEAIYIQDKEGKFLDINKGALDMYGYKREDFIGKTPEFLSAPGKNDLEKTIAHVKKAFEGNTQYFNFWGLRKNGEAFPKEVILNKTNYLGQDAVIATARDISDRYENEEKQRKYTTELKELNAAKDKFFSIIAHDLRSPFNGLLGFSKVLSDEFDDLTKDEVKEYISYVYSSAKNVFNLIENLLQWSRIQTGRMEFQPIRIDLYELVFKIVNLFTSVAIEKHITLRNLVPINAVIKADQNMLNSIIQNLIANALKFTNQGGTVAVSYEHINDFHKITVTDNGVGISNENQKKLFRIDTQYSTTGTANEEGTGLGLILCGELAEQNGGHIHVESELEKGSKFTIILPAIN